MTKSNKVCIAVITGAHGVKGSVRVKSFTAESEAVTRYGALSDASGKEIFDLAITGQTKGQLIASIKGVNNRNAAEALKGLELYVARDALPETEEDEFYHADLIGMNVERANGCLYGQLKAIQNFGANDLLDIHLVDGGSVMLPFTRAVVPTIDMDAGKLIVVPPLESEALPAEYQGKGKML